MASTSIIKQVREIVSDPKHRQFKLWYVAGWIVTVVFALCPSVSPTYGFTVISMFAILSFTAAGYALWVAFLE